MVFIYKGIVRKIAILLILSGVAFASFLNLAYVLKGYSAHPLAHPLTEPPVALPATPEIHFGESVIRVGNVTLCVQIADTAEASEQGLMFRDSLSPCDGMLFVFDVPQQAAFWMKNTRIPLDVGYFDSQKILKEIHPLQPFDETPVYSQSADILYGLELPQGDFARRGIKPGQKLEIQNSSNR